MKSIRGFALGLAVGIAVAIGTVGLAQTTKPVDTAPKAESCCATSWCCHGGSCAMHTAGMEHAKGQMKHSADMKQGEGQMKAHSSEGGCCCCGDSCNMQMKMKEKETQKP